MAHLEKAVQKWNRQYWEAAADSCFYDGRWQVMQEEAVTGLLSVWKEGRKLTRQQATKLPRWLQRSIGAKDAERALDRLLRPTLSEISEAMGCELRVVERNIRKLAVSTGGDIMPMGHVLMKLEELQNEIGETVNTKRVVRVMRDSLMEVLHVLDNPAPGDTFASDLRASVTPLLRGAAMMSIESLDGGGNGGGFNNKNTMTQATLVKQQQKLQEQLEVELATLRHNHVTTDVLQKENLKLRESLAEALKVVEQTSTKKDLSALGEKIDALQQQLGEDVALLRCEKSRAIVIPGLPPPNQSHEVVTPLSVDLSPVVDRLIAMSQSLDMLAKQHKESQPVNLNPIQVQLGEIEAQINRSNSVPIDLSHVFEKLQQLENDIALAERQRAATTGHTTTVAPVTQQFKMEQDVLDDDLRRGQQLNSTDIMILEALENVASELRAMDTKLDAATTPTTTAAPITHQSQMEQDILDEAFRIGQQLNNANLSIAETRNAEALENVESELRAMGTKLDAATTTTTTAAPITHQSQMEQDILDEDLRRGQQLNNANLSIAETRNAEALENVASELRAMGTKLDEINMDLPATQTRELEEQAKRLADLTLEQNQLVTEMGAKVTMDQIRAESKTVEMMHEVAQYATQSALAQLEQANTQSSLTELQIRHTATMDAERRVQGELSELEARASEASIRKDMQITQLATELAQAQQDLVGRRAQVAAWEERATVAAAEKVQAVSELKSVADRCTEQEAVNAIAISSLRRQLKKRTLLSGGEGEEGDDNTSMRQCEMLRIGAELQVNEHRGEIARLHSQEFIMGVNAASQKAQLDSARLLISEQQKKFDTLVETNRDTMVRQLVQLKTMFNEVQTASNMDMVQRVNMFQTNMDGVIKEQLESRYRFERQQLEDFRRLETHLEELTSKPGMDPAAQVCEALLEVYKHNNNRLLTDKSRSVGDIQAIQQTHQIQAERAHHGLELIQTSYRWLQDAFHGLSGKLNDIVVEVDKIRGGYHSQLIDIEEKWAHMFQTVQEGYVSIQNEYQAKEHETKTLLERVNALATRFREPVQQPRGETQTNWEARIDALQQELEAARSHSFEDHESKSGNIQELVNTSKEKLDSCESNLTTMRDVLSSKIEKCLETVKSTQFSSESKIQELNTELENVVAVTSAFYKDLIRSQLLEINELQEKLATACFDTEAALLKTQRKLQTSTDKVSKLEEESKKNQAKMEKMEKIFEDLEDAGDKGSVPSNMTSSGAELQACHHELSALKNRMETKKNSYDSLQKLFSTLRENLLNASRNAKAQKIRADNNHDGWNQVSNQNVTLTTRNEHLKSTHTALRQALSTQKALVAQLNRSLADVNTKYLDKNIELSKTQPELKRLTEDSKLLHESYEPSLRGVYSQLDSLQNEKDNVERELSNLQKRFEAVSKTAETFKQQHSECINNLQNEQFKTSKLEEYKEKCLEVRAALTTRGDNLINEFLGAVEEARQYDHDAFNTSKLDNLTLKATTLRSKLTTDNSITPYHCWNIADLETSICEFLQNTCIPFLTELVNYLDSIGFNYEISDDKNYKILLQYAVHVQKTEFNCKRFEFS